MRKVILFEQLSELAEYLPADMILHLQEGHAEVFESWEGIDLLSFDWCDKGSLSAPPAQVILVLTGQELFLICENDQCLQNVEGIMPGIQYEEAANDRILYLFFVNLIRGDMKYLDRLEEQITDAEDALILSPAAAYRNQIISFRRELLRYRKYYKQLDVIFHGLIENDNELMDAFTVRQFHILHNRGECMYAHVQMLRDYITQVREAYQAQVDIEQNSIMKTFTVITAIFLPLTLIVGWYGMNVRMPETEWQFGYPFVILLSLVVCGICIAFFKKKKWF